MVQGRAAERERFSIPAVDMGKLTIIVEAPDRV
jgi:hypothetical protein